MRPVLAFPRLRFRLEFRLEFHPKWWVGFGLILAAVVWGLALAICWPASAKAQATTVCGPYAVISHNLRELGEQPVFRGLDDRGFVAEAWAGAAGGWTWIYVGTDRRACLVAAGEAGETPRPSEPKAEEREG